ncbi:MAG: DUF3473 domain-containing protein, partial [Bdellovibrionales bacterium]|nr:DUF3473 domain-containing protein [Bdellovibrionales bacterium]
LGYFAKRHPEIVRSIATAGHEIASHGFNHHLVYQLRPDEFREDVSSTKSLLEDLTGSVVRGYRAPNFSITERAPWAHEILVETGHVYDSSVYPVWHPRYANLDKPREITDIETPAGPLTVVPLSAASVSLFGRTLRLPAAGGAYWRLFPRSLIGHLLARVSEGDGLPLCCYFHPWELDPGQPRVAELPMLTRLRHYGGISSFDRRVEYFLRRFPFSTVWEVIQSRTG